MGEIDTERVSISDHRSSTILPPESHRIAPIALEVLAIGKVQE